VYRLSQFRWPTPYRETQPDLLPLRLWLQEEIPGHVDKGHVQTEKPDTLHPPGLDLPRGPEILDD